MEAALTTGPAALAVGGEVLRLAADAKERALRAEADQLVAALRWGLLHQVEDPDAPDAPVAAAEQCPGQSRPMPLAGVGTPQVAEFAVAELAAVLGLTHRSALRLVGDALELAFRLPLTWERIQAGDLPAWRGRALAERTRCLSPEAAGWVDRQVAPFAHRMSAGRVADLVDAALLRIDQSDPERPDPAEARGVDFTRVDRGQVYLRALLDAPDGAALAARVEEVADTLRRLGDDSELPVLRSRALGLLADPQLALDTLTGAETDPAHTVRDTPTDLTLYVHVSADELATGEGVARVEGLGPITLEQVREWAGKTRLTVRPVIDLTAEITVDAYEIPDRLREQVLARDPVCVFPWCGTRSHRRDIDHITPYNDTGPPGQTRSSNLAPLCRFHHRLKTHGHWTYRRNHDGTYHWTSPHGLTYTVARGGTKAMTGVLTPR